MANVYDVAKFFIDFAAKNGEEITNLKLNKMIYFAQARSLATTCSPMFSDTVEAWDYGPVVPSIYREYAQYKRGPIPNPVEVNYDAFTDDEIDILTDVAGYYGQFEIWALVDLTHLPGSPWALVYEKGKSNEIPEGLMAYYFSKPENQPPITENSVFDKLPTIEPRRDSDGVIILPKEFCESDGDEV